MAGDWIKMQRNLLTSPKVVRIMSALDADRFRTVGGLFAVWCLFDEHTECGLLEGYTLDTLDQIVGFAGIGSAMNSVGWLVESEKGIEMKDFNEHNSKSAKRRSQENVRKMSARDADKKRPREKKRREEKINTHTHTAAVGFEKDWSRWLDFREAVDGRRPDPISSEANLMELVRRGPAKAKADIEFSIRKTARTILDSDRDFEKRNDAATTPPKKRRF